MTQTLVGQSRTGSQPVPRGRVDAWTILATTTGALLILGAARPIGDPDIWWHVRLGSLIRADGIPTRETWAFTAAGRPYTPTSWFSDTVLSVTHDLFGWRGIIFLKVALSAVLLFSLYRLLSRNVAPRVAVVVFVLSSLTLSPFLAERPQLASLCFTVVLAGTAVRAMAGIPPSWWWVAITFVWANLHGMWVIAPAFLIVLALGATLDRRIALARRCLAVAAACVLAAAVTPVGPKLLTTAIVVRRAAGDVSEWQPTRLLDHYTVWFTLLLVVWVVSIARGPQPSRSELLWMGAIFVFALVAARNIAPASILASPVVAIAAQRLLWPTFAGRSHPPVVWRGVPLLILLTATVATVVIVQTRAALVSGLPDRIVARLEDDPGPVRVFNSYVVGGYLTGQGAPHVSVAIDGRTEVYDPGYVHRYFAASSRLVGWRSLIVDLDPDAAVIGRNSQLAYELRRAGWHVELTDGDWVLLQPKDAR